MKGLSRLIFAAILVPLSVLLVMFAVANRHFVEVFFDPLVLSISLPLYWVVFLSWFFGLITGICVIAFKLLRWKRLTAKEQRGKDNLNYPRITKSEVQENQ